MDLSRFLVDFDGCSLYLGGLQADFGGLGCTLVTLGGLRVDFDGVKLTWVNLGGLGWTLGSFGVTLS